MRLPDRRQINESRRKLFGTDGRLVAFVCECADPSCKRSVMLTGEDADAMRDKTGWILVSGHEPIDDADFADNTVGTLIAFPSDDR